MFIKQISFKKINHMIFLHFIAIWNLVIQKGNEQPKKN
jgi:hypothetical protein